ncbi:MAG: biopolymer transporter ExbD [Elusimicrobiota bacterium]|nr:MAG: biopolymer transporter ExbD [Elusimicrobiota bacterium]
MAGSPFHRDDEAAAISDVNVVPLADVSLVLLIILLVLSPMAAQSMLKVSAAAARASSPVPLQTELITLREPEKALVIAVAADLYSIDGRPFADARELAAFLKPALSGRDDRKVFVSPELDVEHGRVVSALEAVQESGGAAALVQIADPEAVP